MNPFPDSDKFWRWLASAPLPVVLSICLGTTGMIGTWVWTVAGDVGEQKAVVAVATEHANSAYSYGAANEARLVRLEAKLDRLLDEVADMRRSNKEKNR